MGARAAIVCSKSSCARWTYRNQVISTPHMPPWALFLGVKLSEAAFHLRPRALRRLVRGDDARVRAELSKWVPDYSPR